MEKGEAKELLVDAMGSLFAEAEIEAGIAEAAGISREEYNKIIEYELELPDCIKKYRELNRKKQLYEENLLKHELNEKGVLGSLPPALLLLFTYFPLFQEDYELLKENNYIGVTENGYEWLKSKKCLSEYFGYQIPKCERTPWNLIEILFGIKHLKNSFNHDGKQSKEYENLNKILARKNTPESK